MATSISGVSFSGLSSGIDTASIIQALVAARSQPINGMTAQVTGLNSKKGAFNTLSSQLSAFEDAAKALDNLSDVTLTGNSLGEEFRSLSATSSNTSVFTATVDSARGNAGTHTITVERLAKSSVSKGTNANGTEFASLDAAVATGSISIQVGTGTAKPITIDAAHATLQGVRDAINDAHAGVSATTVYDGTGYQLVVTGSQTGKANDVTIDASGLDQTDPTKALAFTKPQAAADSRVIVDGVAVENSTNTVQDALYGVTLNLNAESTTASTLSVQTDTTAVHSAITAFVAAYNTARSNINSQETYTPGNNTTAPALFGDSTVQGIEQALSRAVSDPVAGGGAYKMLADVGIHLEKDGTMSVDDGALTTALSTNFEDVRSLFVSQNGQDGVAGRVAKLMDSYTNTTDGLIGATTKGIDSEVTDLNDQISKAQDALTSYQDTLTQQFNAMESAISKLKNQQLSLGAIFGTSTTSSSSK